MNFNGVVNIRDYRVRLSPALFPYRGKGVIQVRHVNEVVAGDTAWLRFTDLGSDFFHPAFDKRNPLNLPAPSMVRKPIPAKQAQRKPRITS
jgi:hypothetical protein